MTLLDRLLRRRPPRQAPLLLATVHRWDAEVRVPYAELKLLGTTWLSESMLLGIDHAPPASGPEAAIKLRVCATTEVLAVRTAERIIERGGYTVLAARARRT